jgi:Cft2 family RNA processing exonuclease
MCLRKVVPREVTILPYGEPREVRGVEFTLWPSGHMLGGAQVTVAINGQRVLYSGDFKLKPNLAADPIVVPRAELLIMETTFGHHRYAFPPEDEVIARMAAWCETCLQDGVTPVLLGYSVGKGQEILAALAGHAFHFLLQDSIYQATQLAESLGTVFPPYERWVPGTGSGCVVICPPHLRRWAVDHLPGGSRTAIVSGWAFDPSTRYRYGADAAFCLSDHADYQDLLHYVEQVHPERVYTVHGYATDFAAELRRRGCDAHALDEPDQLALF